MLYYDAISCEERFPTAWINYFIWRNNLLIKLVEELSDHSDLYIKANIFVVMYNIHDKNDQSHEQRENTSSIDELFGRKDIL